jgi:uncharacterized protein with HEPN domain
MKKKRPDSTYLGDMLRAAELATKFLHGISQADFEKDLMRQSAIARQLEIVGEAANHVSKEFQAAHSEIPWQDMIGMRNILIHLYHEMDLKIVWKTVHEALPALIAQLKNLAQRPIGAS